MKSHARHYTFNLTAPICTLNHTNPFLVHEPLPKFKAQSQLGSQNPDGELMSIALDR